MGWIGGAIGYAVGARFGALAGILGAVIGSAVGNLVGDGAKGPQGSYGQTRRRAATQREREVVFLTAVGALLAKLAKADGRVDASEIAAAERAFVRLGLTPGNRAICIQAFRAAKADAHSIFDYAESFAAVARGEPLRQLMYDLLWDVACADGELSPDERRIREMIVTPLRIRPSLFAEQRARRLGGRNGGRAGAARRAPSAPSPYEILGCAPTATDDEVRRAYRAQAKKNHPDLLRAQGLPEEMVARATAQMARLNAAWEEVRRARGL